MDMAAERGQELYAEPEIQSRRVILIESRLQTGMWQETEECSLPSHTHTYTTTF